MIKVEFTCETLPEIMEAMSAFLAPAPTSDVIDMTGVTSTDAPPTDAPPTDAPVPGEVDSKGIPFDPAHHSGTKTASGAWRKKRGAPAAPAATAPPAAPAAPDTPPAATAPPDTPPAAPDTSPAAPPAAPAATAPPAAPGTLLFHELASLAAVTTNLGLEAVVSSALRGNPIETVLGNVDEIQRVGGHIVRALVAEQKWEVAVEQLGADKATTLYHSGL